MPPPASLPTGVYPFQRPSPRGRKGRDHVLQPHHFLRQRGRRHSGHHLAPSGKKILLLELGGWITRKPENWNAEEVSVNSQGCPGHFAGTETATTIFADGGIIYSSPAL